MHRNQFYFFKGKKTCLKSENAVNSMHISDGRIAQLVEHLFYTQAVIGSNPFAPNPF